MPLPAVVETTVSTGFLVVALLCIAAMAVVVLSGLFAGLRYKVAAPAPESLESEEFLYMLEALTFLHLDHFYFDQHLVLEDFALHRTRLSLVASDHLPMVAQFRLPAAQSAA